MLHFISCLKWNRVYLLDESSDSLKDCVAVGLDLLSNIKDNDVQAKGLELDP